MHSRSLKAAVLVIAAITAACATQTTPPPAPAMAAKAETPDCSPSTPVGEVCLLPVADVRPTQFAVGEVAADCKRRKIESKYQEGDLAKYLAKKKRRQQTILGPDGTYFITDRHHLSWGVWAADIPTSVKMMNAEITSDWSDLSWLDFWQKLVDNRDPQTFWPYDDKGLNPMNPRLLPGDLGGLLNDALSTLSRWVRDSNGYLKCADPGDPPGCSRDARRSTIWSSSGRTSCASTSSSARRPSAVPSRSRPVASWSTARSACRTKSAS